MPAGSYSDVLVTEDFTPLEPDLLEDKLYAPGVGVVEEREVKGGTGVVKLIEIVHGPATSGPAPAFDPCHAYNPPVSEAVGWPRAGEARLGGVRKVRAPQRRVAGNARPP